MRRWVVALLLLLPFALTPLCVDWWAQRQAERLGDGLSLAVNALRGSASAGRHRDQLRVAQWRAELDAMWDEMGAQTWLPGASEPVHRRSSSPALSKGIFVSADKVLKLARRGARPSGVPVTASGDRPAGLMLVGVGGLGIGLRDGDVLTHAAGQPAVSEAAVIGWVVRARGARQSSISGRVWRGGQSFPLVVAQPYIQSKSAPASKAPAETGRP